MTSPILLVHGVGHQFAGEPMLRHAWIPALQSGLQLAGSWVEEHHVAAAFYGDLFRPKGAMAGAQPPYTADDLDAGTYEDLLLQLWAAAAQAEPESIMPPGAETHGPVWNQVQRALNQLCRSEFFAGVMERALIGNLKQANHYLTDTRVRLEAQDRIAARISPDTRVIVAHSLGTVVAYEALCAHPEWPVTTFVTLGSPLGIRNFFFDRLRSPGTWPEGLQRWTNIADRSDIVALEKQLAPSFGVKVHDVSVCNGASFHDASRYLTARETGEAIAAGLETSN
jgi:hypothetical protein